MTDDSFPQYRLKVDDLNIDQRTDKAVYITTDGDEVAALGTFGIEGSTVAFTVEAPRTVMRFDATVTNQQTIEGTDPAQIAFDLHLIRHPVTKAFIAYAPKGKG